MKQIQSKSARRKRKSAATVERLPGYRSAPALDSGIPAPDAFLEEAKREPKRQLIHDHIATIKTLRNEKRFTFRAIAEWLRNAELKRTTALFIALFWGRFLRISVIRASLGKTWTTKFQIKQVFR
jgi:hypothetical protein